MAPGTLNVKSGKFQTETLPEYWLSRSEIWARVYSQWITERAGSEAMRKALEKFRGVHWTPDEMRVLGPLLDRFFLQIGWIKP